MYGVSLSLLLLTVVQSAGSAQLTIDQTFKIRQVQEPRASAGGKYVAFTVTEGGRGSSAARHIWLYETSSNALTQLPGEGSDSSPRWAPDGHSLAFLSSKSGPAQIYLWNPGDTKSVALTAHAGGVRSFEWSPDGKRIAFLAAEGRSGRGRTSSVQADILVINSLATAGTPVSLWIFDTDPKTERQLTKAPLDISAATWRPDGLALTVSSPGPPEAEKFSNRILSVSAADGSISEIVSLAAPVTQVRNSPDGSSISYVSSWDHGPLAHDLYVMPAKGGKPVNLTGQSIDRPIAQYSWTSGKTISVLTEAGFSFRLYDLATTGRASPLGLVQPAPSSVELLPDGGFAFTHESGCEMPELWIADRQGHARKVTKFNESWESISLAKPEFFRYKSSDGVEVEAELLKPPAATAGSKLPTIFLSRRSHRPMVRPFRR